MSRFWTGLLAMVAVVAASIAAIQVRIAEGLTLGPFFVATSFLVTGLATRALGPARARTIAYVGTILLTGAILALAPLPRIAVAAFAAFLTAHLLNIALFERWRDRVWWQTALWSMGLACIWDVIAYQTLAHAGSGRPWLLSASADMAIKLIMAVVLLLPYRLLLPWAEAADMPDKG